MNGDPSALMNAGPLDEPGGTLEIQKPGSPAPAPKLKRVVGLGGLAFSCFNSIVGSGIFTMPALAAALLGPAAILAYLICAVRVGLMGLCFAEIGSRVSASGGVYGYARLSFGPVLAGIAGTL